MELSEAYKLKRTYGQKITDINRTTLSRATYDRLLKALRANQRPDPLPKTSIKENMR